MAHPSLFVVTCDKIQPLTKIQYSPLPCPSFVQFLVPQLLGVLTLLYSCKAVLPAIRVPQRSHSCAETVSKWPANSPDCNPVEHCWAWLSKRLVGRSFLTEDDLEAAIRQEWDLRSPNFIPSLYGSMVRRLTAVVVARGAATRY